MTSQQVTEAVRKYAEASRLAPEIIELPFWQAVAFAAVGRWNEAEPLFTAVFAKEPAWAELVPRLPPAGLLPNDPALVARIQALARPDRRRR
jgi:hypothetical protein